MACAIEATPAASAQNGRQHKRYSRTAYNASLCFMPEQPKPRFTKPIIKSQRRIGGDQFKPTPSAQYSHKKTWAVPRPRLIDYRLITQD